jgi:hypothetical protein
MAETGEIRDLIRAAAEGATGGLAAMRSAGVAVEIADFAVEIDYCDGEAAPEVAASVRLSFGLPGGSAPP